MTENWKPIPGLEQYYEVSDLGRVRAFPRQTRNRHGAYTLPARMTPTHCNKAGYMYFKVSPAIRKELGITQNYLVHHAVAYAFLGPRPADAQICHNDGVSDNNVLSNLRYGTASDNQRDRRLHGTHHYGNRTHCKNGHEYTPESMRIRKIDSGYGPTEYRVCLVCKRERARL